MSKTLRTLGTLWILRTLRALRTLGTLRTLRIRMGCLGSEMLWRAPACCPAGVCGSCLEPSLCEFVGTFHAAP